MVSAQGEAPIEVARVPLPGNKVHLRMECDLKDGADSVSFAYSFDGKSWMPIGKPHQLRYDLVHFMGCRFGLFNFATKSPGGYVDFDSFRVSDKRTLSAP
jgi:beta-xylosidase